MIKSRDLWVGLALTSAGYLAAGFYARNQFLQAAAEVVARGDLPDGPFQATNLFGKKVDYVVSDASPMTEPSGQSCVKFAYTRPDWIAPATAKLCR